MKALFFAAVAASDELSQLLHDALANHAWVVAGLAGVLILVPLVLSAVGVKVPLLDPLLEVLTKVLASFSKKPAPPAPAPVDPAAQPGVTNVVEIKSLGEADKKDAGL